MTKDTTSFFNSLRIFTPYLDKKSKKCAIGLLGLSFTSALSELALAGSVALLATFFASPEKSLEYIPKIITPFFTFLGSDPRHIIFMALVFVVLVIIIKNVLAVIVQRLTANLAESIGIRVRSEILQFFSQAPYLWLLRTGTPDMFFGISAVQQLGPTLILCIQIFNNIAIFILFLIGLVLAAPIPSLVLLITLVAGGQIIIKGLRKAIDKCAQNLYQANYATHNLQQLSIHALKEIRLYGRGKILIEQYKNCLQEVKKTTITQNTFSRLPVFLLEILGFFVLLLILGGLIWIQDASVARITGIMGFMAAAAWRLLPVMNRLLEAWAQVRNFLPYLHKSANLIQEKEQLVHQLLDWQKPNTAPLHFTKNISVKKLHFSYSENQKNILHNLTFTIPKRSTVGIIGLSGAGKSTLINLLAGLIPATSGQICIDETPLTLENTQAWLKKIGYVDQAPYILNASLAENISLSNWGEPIDKKRILECCQMAALDFIDTLHDGINTVLGDRGTRLSGGQAQRVVIARALYSKPELIIFDEATSSLDMKNEKAVHQTILSLREHATLVIIAHRLSSVEGCDQIIWLEQGEIKQAGNAQTVLVNYKNWLSAHPEKLIEQ